MLEVEVCKAVSIPTSGKVVYGITPSSTVRKLAVDHHRIKLLVRFDTGETSVLSDDYEKVSTSELTVPAKAATMTFEVEVSVPNRKRGMLTLNTNDFVTRVSEWADYPTVMLRHSSNSALVSVPSSLPKALTSLRSMFYGCAKFNDANVSLWDTSNITDMDSVFAYNTIFNRPLNNWNVAQVTSLRSMFFDCPAFNQPLNNWDTRNVKDMWGLFFRCVNFNQTIVKWNVTKVTEISNMFSVCSKFNQDLSKLIFGSTTNRANYDNLCTAWNTSYRPKFTG